MRRQNHISQLVSLPFLPHCGQFIVDILTAGSFTVVTEVALLGLLSYSCLFPHLVDFRHAEFRVEAEKEPSIQNSQVVLIPVPQILQVLVVDGGERIHPD